ncbi:tRNA a64-2'-O-ribosylphosphate transferase [Lepidopterella palustris CBS 459.81]|uniref:tRNA a64-2'-O-ribosylphosphate transferase n=1 Tax=Lepidopterella palustris CBS 459.81 TaxID=1314670 RepID=A0A8E2E4S1_9PEZI|nr:tRNA a64-2'-O-ribosylphosphate transferase [Lepidopterella palustris CBS 459.81]
MSQPLKTSDIIFPSQSTDFSATLSSLKRSALSIFNRLNSISQDAEFVCSVADAYNLPLIANERCGSWYIPPPRKASSAYFKSTDGHTGEWSFSLRRLNIQVLDIVGHNDGCVIVDSTRRGKNMPDALSKTVPIWCCVWNRLFFPEIPDHPLHTPPQSISPSEHSQIEARLASFVHQVQELNLPLATLRRRISKPLRPIWVTVESTLPFVPPVFLDFHPVILCTSSRRVRGGEVSESGYVQGAGDDSEVWACGLTPSLFWKHREQFLRTNEEDLPGLITRLVEGDSESTKGNPVPIKPTSNLYVGSTDLGSASGFDAVISCGEDPVEVLQAKLKSKYLHLKCRAGKLGSRDLRDELPKLETFFMTLRELPETILVCCHTGKDLSLGVALAILCIYTDDEGTISTHPTSLTVSKPFIRQRLSWITTSLPTANPSRSTLQSINSHLIRPSPPHKNQSSTSSSTSPAPRPSPAL